jgi:hypothetical protein
MAAREVCGWCARGEAEPCESKITINMAALATMPGRESLTLYCTRRVKHKGDHLACGSTIHNLAAWAKK